MNENDERKLTLVSVKSETQLIEGLVAIDQRIDGSEHDGLLARWEFGRELLQLRQGNQLPNGVMDGLVAKTGKRAPRSCATAQAARVRSDDSHSADSGARGGVVKRRTSPRIPCQEHHLG